MYDPAYGRFTGVDPIADQFAFVSVYNYAENRVPNGIDLWGLQYQDANGMNYSQYTVDPLNSITTLAEIRDLNGNGIQDYYLPVFEFIEFSNDRVTTHTPSSADFGSSNATAVGAVATILSNSIYSEKLDVWRGKNGKPNRVSTAPGKSKPFTGNQYTGSVSKAKFRGGYISSAGNVFGVYSMAATHAEFLENRDSGFGPNMTRHLKHRYKYDQAANGIGFLGFYGAVGSLVYNAGHMLESSCGCNIQYNPITKDFTPIEETLMYYDNLGIDVYEPR